MPEMPVIEEQTAEQVPSAASSSTDLPPAPPEPQAAGVSEPASTKAAEPVMEMHDVTDTDDEGGDSDMQDSVGTKRRGIRLKQDLN